MPRVRVAVAVAFLSCFSLGPQRLGLVGVGHAVEGVGVAAGTSSLDVCAGDCNTDFRVSVSELIQGVNIALERAPAANCRAVDGDADGRVTIAEVVRAVGNALGVCPCPFDFATPSLQAGVACVYEGRWNDTCGDGSLQATYAGDGNSLGVALIVGGDSPPVAFLSVVQSANQASLAGYVIGDTTETLPGSVTLSADRRDLRVEPAEPADLVIRDCAFEAYAGRLVEVVELR